MFTCITQIQGPGKTSSKQSVVLYWAMHTVPISCCHLIEVSDHCSTNRYYWMCYVVQQYSSRLWECGTMVRGQLHLVHIPTFLCEQASCTQVKVSTERVMPEVQQLSHTVKGTKNRRNELQINSAFRCQESV